MYLPKEPLRGGFMSTFQISHTAYERSGRDQTDVEAAVHAEEGSMTVFRDADGRQILALPTKIIHAIKMTKP